MAQQPTNDLAQARLAEALRQMQASSPDWYFQTLSIMGVMHESVAGELGASPISKRRDPETDLIKAMGKIAGRYPADWHFRVARYMLLVDLKLRENASKGGVPDGHHRHKGK